MESISAEVVLPSLSYPADLHNEAACHHIISSHCFEGVPELPVDDAEHPDSGSASGHSSRGEILLGGSSPCSREKEEQMDTASDQPSGLSQDESQVAPLHSASSSADEPSPEALSANGAQLKEEKGSHENDSAGAPVPSMPASISGLTKLNKGSARNRGGVCEGVPRRRSYVRAAAAQPTPETEQVRNKLRPKNSKPITWEKRKYVRKATFQADVPMLDAEGEVGYGGGESDLLYGCTKCRYLRAGCTSCRHKPSMERDAKIRWRPEKGRPQLAVPTAPTFRPTAEEFRDPIQYIEKIRPEAEKFGIACVVPPEGFNPPFALEKGTNGLNSESFRFTVRKQTTSHLCMREPNALGGKKATSRYRQANASAGPENEAEDVPVDFGFTNLDKPYTLRSFSAYSDWVKSVHYSALENEKSAEVHRPDIPSRKKKLFQYSGPEPSVEEQEAEFWRIVEDPEEVVESLYGQDLDSGHHGSGFPLPPFRQALLEQHLAQQAAALREKSGHEAVEVSLPPRRFTPEEEEYSLHAWNINNLPRNRGSVLRYIVGDELITGVMVPWLYVGSCMSAFCWHVEDHALYSVNYMHLGAPKVWYGVPAHASEALEEAMNDALPHLFESAPDLLYQLVTLVSPVELQARGVPVCRLVHREGSFVITFPNAYHAGFNTGFNVAEAVNFGPPDWLRWGSYIVEKYRREARPATLSMDALLISLVRAAPDVKRYQERRKAEAELVVELAVLGNGQVKVVIRTRGSTLQKRSATPEQNGVPTKRSSTSKDGKRLTLSTLDPVSMEDVPEAAVRLAAGELALRIKKELHRQKAGLADILTFMPRRRMEGKPGAVDRDGVHTNTDDVDCVICKGDLYLTSVVSRECPGIATCPEHAKALPSTNKSKVLLYRYSLEELHCFLDEARECIPGTAEAIAAAFDREANPEPQPVVKHLGPIVHLGDRGDRGPMLRRTVAEKRPAELDLRESPVKRERKNKKRSLPFAGNSAAKKPRAPYGSKKAAREAAAAAASAAKLALPSRESRRRMSSMKAQAIIADALAEAEVEITDAALPEPRRRNPRNPTVDVKVERTKGADQSGTSLVSSPPKAQTEGIASTSVSMNPPPALAPVVESSPSKTEQPLPQQVLSHPSLPEFAKLANFQAIMAAQLHLAANSGLMSAFNPLMMANEAFLKMMSGQLASKPSGDGLPQLPTMMPPWPLPGVMPSPLSPGGLSFPGLSGMGQSVATPAASRSSTSPQSGSQLSPAMDGKLGQLPRPFVGSPPPVMAIPSASALCGQAHLLASVLPNVFNSSLKPAGGSPVPVTTPSASTSGKEGQAPKQEAQEEKKVKEEGAAASTSSQQQSTVKDDVDAQKEVAACAGPQLT